LKKDDNTSINDIREKMTANIIKQTAK